MIINWQGLLIGACTFLIIGLFHPLVIKGYYHWGLKITRAFWLLGIAATISAILIASLFWSSLLAVVGFSSFWSVKEVYEQRERVRKGWFPENPNRKNRK